MSDKTKMNCQNDVSAAALYNEIFVNSFIYYLYVKKN